MTEYRRETDFLGEIDIPVDALWGAATARAVENFPLCRRPIQTALISSYGKVKLACLQTNHELGYIPQDIYVALSEACEELIGGKLSDQVIVDALQGGAGTSTNMNVNEVLANRALTLYGSSPGDYQKIHPLEQVNLHQSTNDTYPTALKLAAITLLRELQREVISLTESFQTKEREFADIVKVGRTQMQDAVLTTLGRSMSAYAEALARDRWRLYKCEERLRVINLGGTAIGTGIGAPREFIFRVVDRLREISGIGLARAENLVEATQNADVFVEVSGIVRACATNLLKISGDLRFLSSGPDAGIGELKLPPRQAGSTIMPGKVNPVIPEAVTQACLLVYSNDTAIASACGMGNLELNPFLPLVAECLLENLKLLTNSCSILRRFCVAGLQAESERCAAHLDGSVAVATALADYIGYERAAAIHRQAKEQGQTIKRVVIEAGLLSERRFDEIIGPERVNRLGSKREKEQDE